MQEEARKAAQEAVDITMAQYRAGTADYLAVIVLQAALLAGGASGDRHPDAQIDGERPPHRSPWRRVGYIAAALVLGAADLLRDTSRARPHAGQAPVNAERTL